MSATISPDALQAFKEYQANLRWAKEHDVDLDRYTDRFVAVSGQKIVAVAPSKSEIQAQVSKIAGVYVTYVYQKRLSWIL